MDGTQGIAVDNFSLRGSSGLSLRSIPVRTMREFNELRPYDLIVLQYGLNVATERGRNYDRYRDGMLTTIAHLKQAFPKPEFSLSVWATASIKPKRAACGPCPALKTLSVTSRIWRPTAGGFLNMFEAMGGEGSMADMVHAKPSLANYDYTHINFRGGKHLAELLYEALVYGKEQYDRRRAYEAEP